MAGKGRTVFVFVSQGISDQNAVRTAGRIKIFLGVIYSFSAKSTKDAVWNRLIR